MSAQQRRQRKERAAFIAVLTDLNTYSKRRIELGDFDLDDTIYRTRDATAVLLEIYGGEA